jgi:hypothetical protein
MTLPSHVQKVGGLSSVELKLRIGILSARLFNGCGIWKVNSCKVVCLSTQNKELRPIEESLEVLIGSDSKPQKRPKGINPRSLNSISRTKPVTLVQCFEVTERL